MLRYKKLWHYVTHYISHNITGAESKADGITGDHFHVESRGEEHGDNGSHTQVTQWDDWREQGYYANYPNDEEFGTSYAEWGGQRLLLNQFRLCGL